MRFGLLLALLAALPAAAQNNAEPQYQLTGQNYSSEATAIQQMFYNTQSGLKQLQTQLNSLGGSSSSSGSSTGPNVQKFTSGSGTYTFPAGRSWLHVRECAGGGGGGGTTTSGGDGGISLFGTIAVSSGIHGIHASGTSCTGGGAGGTGGTGGEGVFTSSTVVRYAGQDGGCSQDASGTGTDPSGAGGSSVLFGGGAPSASQSASAAPISGISAKTNSGGGGSGCAQDGGCSGGGGGECADIWIQSPAATYPYTVGAAGTAGTGTFTGGTAGAGKIIVEAY